MRIYLVMGVHGDCVCQSAFPVQTTTSLRNTGLCSPSASDDSEAGEGVVTGGLVAGKMETEQ